MSRPQLGRQSRGLALILFTLLAAPALLLAAESAAEPTPDPPPNFILDASGTTGTPRKVEETAVEHAEFRTAHRLVSDARGGRRRMWQTRCNMPTNQPIARGDAVHIVFFARCVASESTDGKGSVYVVFGSSVGAPSPRTNTFVCPVTLDGRWRRFSLAFHERVGRPAGEAGLFFAAGHEKQVVEVGGVEVFNYGKRRIESIEGLTTYDGIEPDAPWRHEALERIDAIRKAPIEVVVVDAEGEPVVGANVHVQMTKHAFLFGCSYCPYVYQQAGVRPADVRKYRETFRRLFNYVTFEAFGSWTLWEGEKTQSLFRRAYDDLQSRGRLPVNFLPVVWPYPKVVPEEVNRLLFAERADDYIAAWNEHLEEKMREAWPFAERYMVINELSAYQEHLPAEKLRPAIVNWCQLAQAENPQAKLGIQDHKQLYRNGRDFEQLEWFEDKVRLCVEHDVRLSYIGFQAHFDEAVTDPEVLLTLFDRFGKYGIPIQITELDVRVDNDDLQAAYLRDFMIACFSHPLIEAVTQWGFWEPAHWRPRAALFHENWEPKPAGRAYADLVLDRWWTDQRGVSDGEGLFTTTGFLGEHEAIVSKDGKQKRQTFSLGKGRTRVLVRLD